jgi:hypothetical protein
LGRFETINYFSKEKEKPEKRKRKSDGLPAGKKCRAVPVLLWINELSFKIRETGTLAMALHFFFFPLAG